jgi:hypothetical protein
MPDKYYRFSLTHHGFSVELRLNDVIIDTDPDGMFRNRSFVNNQYILDGKNTVKLTLGLPGAPPKLPQDLTLTCTVHELAADQLGGPNFPAPLLLLQFPGNQVPTFPASITGSFETKSPFGRWAWQDAERIDPVMPDDVLLCASLVKKTHTALTQKSLQTLLPLLSIKTAEMALAFYVPPEERRKDQEQFFQQVFGDSQFAMERFETDDLEIVPMGENRVFLVRHLGGIPALESKELSEGYCFTLPIIASKIGGEWKVVR